MTAYNGNGSLGPVSRPDDPRLLPMTAWLLLLLIVVLTLGTAVFVTAEFALVALDRPTVQGAVHRGDTGARTILPSLAKLSTQLSAAQVGITLTTLIVGFLTQPSLGTLLEDLARSLDWPSDLVAGLAAAVALVLVTMYSMVFGELVPQFLGISVPLRAAKVVARPVRAFSVVAKPVIALLNGSANAFLRSVGVVPQEELSGARTPQELAYLVQHSVEVGTLDADTAQRVTRTLGFGERTADDVMTPRVRCTAIDRTASAADVLRLARTTGHSRFPVIGEDFDDIDGVVHVKRAMAVPAERRDEVPVSALMVPHLVVPETIRLDPLLLQLRTAGLQMAVVVDEYGGTSGLVTLEDLIEELVGEVADEHDRSRVEGRRLGSGAWSVPGMWRPDELRQQVGAPVPDGTTYETLGGYVMAALGRVPDVGDSVRAGIWRLEVSAMDGRRVERLRVTGPAASVQPPERAEAD